MKKFSKKFLPLVLTTALLIGTNSTTLFANEVNNPNEEVVIINNASNILESNEATTSAAIAVRNVSSSTLITPDNLISGAVNGVNGYTITPSKTNFNVNFNEPGLYTLQGDFSKNFSNYSFVTGETTDEPFVIIFNDFTAKSSVVPPFVVGDNSITEVLLMGTNTLDTSEGDFAALTLKSTKLTIDGEGTLNAYGGGTGAGIGTHRRFLSTSNIQLIINGGIINAVGGASGGPGIGTGGQTRTTHENAAEYLLINGGTINAKGGTGAAGIGEGRYAQPFHYINIAFDNSSNFNWGIDEVFIKDVASYKFDIDITAEGNGGAAGIGRGRSSFGEYINDNLYNINIGNNLSKEIEYTGDIKIKSTGGNNGGAGIGGSISVPNTFNGLQINIGGYAGGPSDTIRHNINIDIEAHGKGGAAGIGSGKFEFPGTINIDQGNITAYGSEGGAGIGSGYGSDYPSVGLYITGGNIKAYGDGGGAGIGSAAILDSIITTKMSPMIYIYGGNIEAHGSEGGAGIGGGAYSSSYVNIVNNEISESYSIKAYGSKGGAGIGAGVGNGGQTRIEGYNSNSPEFEYYIEAYGGSEGGAGIGGGGSYYLNLDYDNPESSTSQTYVSISSGNIKAFGGTGGGAGIGGGAGTGDNMPLEDNESYYDKVDASIYIYGGNIITIGGNVGGSGVGAGAKSTALTDINYSNSGSNYNNGLNLSAIDR